MRQQFRDLETWRGKLTATWIILAPPAAMVAVFIAGGGPSNTFVVDAHALDQRQDSVFDDLADDVPDVPGVDGSVGTEKRSSIEVPVTGTLDSKQQPVIGPLGSATGIPGTVLAAYQKAARDLAVAQPGCHLTWPLLAGIGKVESSHASGGRVDAAGNTRGQILGPVLDGGPGMAAISDTDQGRYDGNTRWYRAVGPMQFIPGTWTTFGADGNGDGVKSPHNVFDAARAAGDYLCSNGANLSDPQGLVQAVLRYNHSMDYVSTVLRWMQTYAKSAVTTPNEDGVIPPPSGDNGNVQKDDDPRQIPVDDSITRPAATTSATASASAAATTSATDRPAQPRTSSTPTKNLPTTPPPTSQMPPRTSSTPTTSPTPTSTPSSPTASPTENTPSETPTESPSPSDSATPPDSATPSESPSETPSETPSESPSEEPTSPPPSTSPDQTCDADDPSPTPTPSPTTSPTLTPTPEPTCTSESAAAAE